MSQSRALERLNSSKRVVGAARLECGEPAAESGELIRRQLGNSFGDFFDFHGAQLTSSNLLPARQDIGALRSL
jgi:hypothetical protein